MSEQEKSSVEWLKNKLYSRKGAQVGSDVRTPLSARTAQAPVAWTPLQGEEEQKHTIPPLAMAQKKKSSLATKFLLGSALFFVVALGAAAYIFFGGANLISPQNIDLQIVAPSLIDGGKQASFEILIDNRNQSPLTLADLIINYPDGTRDPNDQTQTLSHETQTIGTINAGEQTTRTATAIIYGQAGATESVNITLQYSVPGSNAVFEKQASVQFLIGSSPISLLINEPSEAIAGQLFPIDITLQSNASTPIDNVVVEGQYPFGFSVASSSPKASTGGTLWRLGTLAPGASEVIHLMGIIDGQDGDQRVFRFLAGSDADVTDTQIAVPFLSVPETLTVRKPFITGAITLNGQTGKIIAITPGQTVEGAINWPNNLTEPVSNAQVTLSLSGPTLDTSSVNASNGFYQSSNSTITWSPAQESSLALVPPGGTGTLQFSFSTLAPGAGGTVYQNPAINLNLSITGQRQGQGNVPEQISSAASVQAQVVSALSLMASALHFSGSFTNTGPMPPKSGGATSYTILWIVKNSSNSIANAQITTTLPPYVQFVQAQAGTGITYDATSRTVTWNLGDLSPGVGYSSSAVQAAFQVSLTPSDSQIGIAPSLTGAVTLQGADRFAQVSVTSTAPAPTTLLSNDPGFQSGMDLVQSK